jgi:hypothetical protein
MPIEMTPAQAERVASLARDLGGQVWIHQLANGKDVYLAPAGEENRYLISAAGDPSEVDEHAADVDPSSAP